MLRLNTLEFLTLSFCLALTVHLIPGSTYATPELMSAYFGGENTPGSWSWEFADGSWTREFEPFKYRVVFRGLVDGLAHLLLAFGAERNLHTYWMAYLTVSLSAHVFALFACHLFLKSTGLNRTTRQICLTAWVLLPPTLFAYTIPVQTKEDFIAYGLFFLALRAMLQGNWKTVVFICFFGAFVRETLLFVAGIFLIGTDAPRRMKIAALSLPMTVHILLRVSMGMHGYDVYRETNFESYLLPVAAFLLAFGFGWMPVTQYVAGSRPRSAIRLGLSVFQKDTDRIHASLTGRLKALQNAFPYALGLLMVAQLCMGRIQEIRILYLLSPFVLLALADMLSCTGSSKSRALFGALIGSGATTVVLVGVEALGIGTLIRDQLNATLAEFAQVQWWANVYLQLILAAGLIGAAKITRYGEKQTMPVVFSFNLTNKAASHDPLNKHSPLSRNRSFTKN